MRVFCIIIIASYRSSLHCCLHLISIIQAFLDDLWNFPTKYLFLVFNIWETENLLFPYFAVSMTFRNSKSSGIFTASIFYYEKQLEHWNYTRGATRTKRAWVAWPTFHVVPPGLVWPLSVSSYPSFYVRLRLKIKPTLYFS
jgi:hypothetical protein